MPWRAMETRDLQGVNSVAGRVHLNYREDAEVFAERLRLYPKGCFVLKGRRAGIVGYVVSHPWQFRQPPALNALLKKLPVPGSTYYVHDIALLPAARANGAASDAVRQLIAHATEARFPNVSLVAVNDSEQFWERHGFHTFEDATLSKALATYDRYARYMVRRNAP
ncbi:GNAT family N-acetyltransferase [Bradyrhizobium sp. USDA 4454]